MPKIKTNDIMTYYEIYGEGYPFVFIHGGWVSHRYWDPQVEYFSRRYKVIIYDIRGHGESEGSDRKYLTELFAAEGVIHFETGTLSKEENEAIFANLPVDITFVDKDDTVRYFNQSKERIFPRTKAVLGRKVQQCHPQKSIHVVNKILDDFRNGRREVAEFWIQLKGRLIYIRYFPVRDKNGEYLGCLEVTQDITGIKKIEGERRLLD